MLWQRSALLSAQGLGVDIRCGSVHPVKYLFHLETTSSVPDIWRKSVLVTHFVLLDLLLTPPCLLLRFFQINPYICNLRTTFSVFSYLTVVVFFLIIILFLKTNAAHICFCDSMQLLIVSGERSLGMKNARGNSGAFSAHFLPVKQDTYALCHQRLVFAGVRSPMAVFLTILKEDWKKVQVDAVCPLPPYSAWSERICQLHTWPAWLQASYVRPSSPIPTGV